MSIIQSKLQDVADQKEPLELEVDFEEGRDINVINVQGCNDIQIQITRNFIESATVILQTSIDNVQYAELARHEFVEIPDVVHIFQHVAALQYIRIVWENKPPTGTADISVRAKEIS